MSTPRSRLASIVLPVLIIVAVSPARAREPAKEPAVVPVEISATQPGSFIQVRGRGQEFACGEHCVLQLPQHDYNVLVRDRDGNDSKTALTIMTPTRLAVTPGNEGFKMLGIGLFAGGVAATVVALAMVSLAWDAQVCAPDCRAPMWQWYAAGISLAAGAGLGATGIIVWKASAHARVAVSPLALTGSF